MLQGFLCVNLTLQTTAPKIIVLSHVQHVKEHFRIHVRSFKRKSADLVFYMLLNPIPAQTCRKSRLGGSVPFWDEVEILARTHVQYVSHAPVRR